LDLDQLFDVRDSLGDAIFWNAVLMLDQVLQIEESNLLAPIRQAFYVVPIRVIITGAVLSGNSDIE